MIQIEQEQLNAVPPRPASAMLAARRVSNARRLAKPVNGSCKANRLSSLRERLAVSST
uniref:hypothetical protein n=1 Tax=Methylogaea oryzae TaxID=1295382 RepID=UPI003570F48F